MNDIVNDKKGHNIVNDNKFAISHTVYLLFSAIYPVLW